MRLTPLVAVLATATAAACATDEGADDAPAASFDKANEAQIARMIEAGLGGDAIAARGVAGFAESMAHGSGCPHLVDDGGTVTLTGGCLDERGNRWDGTLVMRDEGTRLELTGFAFQHGTRPAPTTYDGTLTITETAITGDITRHRDAIRSRSVVDLVGSEYAFAVRGPSTVEVEGIGRADLTGSWKLKAYLSDPPATGAATLTGADVAYIDVTGGDARGCYPYTINGAFHGILCYAESI
ncbi:MAG: hypothetical protein KIT31_42610 [Deltaproteobacteria bacterium]|nr:hypothetical protein [Deltaproteobacteria bacterium]